MDRIYFLCEKGGKTESAILEHVNHNESVVDSWGDFAKANGGTGMIYAGDWAEGFQFDGEEPPIGWHRTKSMPKGYYKPKKGEKLKVFKALGVKIGASEFSKSIYVDPICAGMSIYFASYAKYGDTAILSLVNGMTVPADVKELKMSEYFKVKEKYNDK